MNLAWTVDTANSTAAVHISGDLDYLTAGDLVDTVSRLLAEQPELRHVRLDCSRLTFCDSAGLSGLLLIHRKTSDAAVRLHLDDRPAFLDRVLRITGTLEHLTAPRARAGGLADGSDVPTRIGVGVDLDGDRPQRRPRHEHRRDGE